MHVARAQPEHEDGGEMAHRIAAMRMQHQLRLRRGARGEIEQHRIVGPGRTVRREFGRVIEQAGIGVPACRCVADGDARQALVEAFELRSLGGSGDHVARASALEPVGEIDRREQGGGGNDNGAQFHGRQHHLPERRHVAQHQQHPVAALHAQRAQSVGDPVGAFGQFGEGEAGGAVAHDLQGGLVGQRPTRQLGVEPVERPVEVIHLRPPEVAIGRRVVAALRQQEFTRCLVRLDRLSPARHRMPRILFPPLLQSWTRA